MIPEFIIKWFMEKIWDRIFPKKNENLEIIKIYEEKIQVLEEDKERLSKKKELTDKEIARIIDSIKRSGFSTKRVIETYDKPLNAIFISYASQYEQSDKKYLTSSHFLRTEFEKYNSRYLGGTDVIIPPKYVPKTIKNREDLQQWFEKEILKGRFCKLKLLALIDLRDKMFCGCYLPYKQKEPHHHTIEEVLRIDDLLTDEEIISKLSIARLIRDGDIVWLASTTLPEKELGIIHENQEKIEAALGNPSLRVLADEKMVQKLTAVLKGYLETPEEISKKIVNEAKFWESRIR